MTKAQIYAGIAKGAGAAWQDERERPDRENRRALAQQRQELGALKLQEYVEAAPTRKATNDAQLAAVQNQLAKQNSTMLRDRTYESFRMYDADGDTRHLNRFLQEAKQNPAGQRMYGDYARIDPLSASPDVVKLLRQAGYNDIDAVLGNEQLAKGLVVATKTDGSQTLIDMNELYAGTGYAQYMTNEQLATMTERAKLNKMLRGPESAVGNMIAKIAKEEGISMLEATEKYYSAQRLSKATGAGTSGVERIAAQYQQEDPSLSYEDSVLKAQRTSKQRELEGVKNIRAELDSEGFFEADLTNSAERRKFGPRITEIERLTGKELSNEEKRFMRDARTLLSLGGTAGEELGAAETGLVDSMLKDVRKYVSDSVEGTAGTSSYESFRNVFRNALYGASLTQAEIDAFRRAAGSLGEQLGPVLTKLRTQMQTIKDSVQGVYDMQDEHVAHYYVGTSLDDLDMKLAALDERIELIDSSGGQAGPITAQPAPAAKRSLDEIWAE